MKILKGALFCPVYRYSYFWTLIWFLLSNRGSLVMSQRGGSRGYNNYRDQTGAFGGDCVSQCSRYGSSGQAYDYYFCYTAASIPSNWDYCSPRPGTDHKNNVCSGPCTKGLMYTWCYTRNGGGEWGYCGTFVNDRGYNNNYNGGGGRGGGYRDNDRDGYRDGRGGRGGYRDNDRGRGGYRDNRGGYRGNHRGDYYDNDRRGRG